MRKNLWSLIAATVLSLWITACGSDAAGAAGGVAATGGTGGVGADAGISGTGGVGADGGTSGVGADGGGAPTCPAFSFDDPTAVPGVTLAIDLGFFGADTVGFDGEYYYFKQGPDLERASITTLVREVVGTLGNVRPALVGDHVVWSEAETTPDLYRLVAAPVSDLANRITLAEGLPFPGRVLTDGVHYYVSIGPPDTIRRVPIAGGSLEVFIDNINPSGLALHGGYVWWMDFDSRKLMRASLQTGVRETLGTIFHGGVMFGHGDTMYWGDSSNGALSKWSEATGVVRLSTGDPNALAADDNLLYWADGFVSGSVLSVPTMGGETTQILCGLSDPGPLYLTPDYVIVYAAKGVLRIDR